jgi:hypothetical protein
MLDRFKAFSNGEGGLRTDQWACGCVSGLPPFATQGKQKAVPTRERRE